MLVRRVCSLVECILVCLCACVGYGLATEGAVDWDALMSTKYAPWGCLGFLTTIVETPSGTFKRGLLRMTGVLLGSLSGWILLLICGKHHGWAHGLWLTVFDFLAVWISVDRTSPTNGFNPSWGYAMQLFTYQQTIIATEAYLGMADRDELVLARLVGQSVGIGTAVLISCLLIPTRANRCIRMKIADTLHCLHESLNALAEIVALQQEIHEPNIQLLDTWTAYEVSYNTCVISSESVWLYCALICMCIYFHMCMYVYMRMYVYVCVHMCIYVYVSVLKKVRANF